MLVMIDSVAGMMNAPPMPMSPRVKISWFGVSTSARRERAEPEHRHAELQRAAAAEAVTEAARGEQQAREHERVGVDDPLELAVASRRGRRTSVGIATLRIELSTMITSRLRQSTPRIHHRWLVGAGRRGRTAARPGGGGAVMSASGFDTERSFRFDPTARAALGAAGVRRSTPAASPNAIEITASTPCTTLKPGALVLARHDEQPA